MLLIIIVPHAVNWNSPLSRRISNNTYAKKVGMKTVKQEKAVFENDSKLYQSSHHKNLKKGSPKWVPLNQCVYGSPFSEQ